MFALAAGLLVAGSAAPAAKKRPDILFLARCAQPSSTARYSPPSDAGLAKEEEDHDQPAPFVIKCAAFLTPLCMRGQ